MASCCHYKEKERESMRQQRVQTRNAQAANVPLQLKEEQRKGRKREQITLVVMHARVSTIFGC